MVQFDREIDVGSIIRSNDNVAAISYFDSELGRNVGYVNIYGGVGKNFIVEENIYYELIAKENSTLYIH